MRFLFQSLLALSLSVAMYLAWPQQPSTFPVVGFLATAPVGPNDPLVEVFREGLRDFGYVEGQNIHIEFRSAQGHVDRLPTLAQELVQRRVSAIVVGTEAAVRATKGVTDTIPIVAILFDYDPVASGLVDSLARPGGNVTGIFTRSPELVAKRIELLKEALPRLSRVAVLYDSQGARQLDDVASAARFLGIKLERLEMQAPYDYAAAFRTAKQRGAGSAILLYSGVFYADRARIAEAALKERLPIISWLNEMTRAGGLMSYGHDGPTSYRRIAYFIDRLLKGSKPSDLPMEQPLQFQLVVNLKTAKALGLTIPESILLRADQVIR